MAAWDSRSPAISQKETKRTKVRGVGFAFLGACVMTEVRAQVIIVPNSLATNDGNAFNTTPSGPGSVVTGNQTLGELVNVTSNSGATGVSVTPKVTQFTFAPPPAISTCSDANWSSTGGMAGADGTVEAAVVDGSGNLYIGGLLSVAGEVIANHVAKWNGSNWSALGSGIEGGVVTALAVSGSNLYAAGDFTIAGGSTARYIARWDGSSWSAVGSGLAHRVHALAVSGSDLYSAGWSHLGISRSRLAKWDGSAWTELASGMNGAVRALVVSGSDLFAGGYFTTVGGKVSAYVAGAYLRALPTFSVLRSGENVTVSWPTVDTAGFALEQADSLAAPAGSVTHSGTVTDDGATKSVTLSVTKSSQFFRLRRP